MTTISIECPRCQRVAFVPATSLLVDLDGSPSDDSPGYVAWICPRCAELVTNPVGWPQLLAIVAAGAPLLDEEEDLPEPHPVAPPSGPALTRDDELDLHTLLARPTWFAELENAITSTNSSQGDQR